MPKRKTARKNTKITTKPGWGKAFTARISAAERIKGPGLIIADEGDAWRKEFVAEVAKILEGHLSVADLYVPEFNKRQAVILEGLPAKTTLAIARDMGVSNELVYDVIGAPRATVNRQLRNDKPLSPAASERAVFLAELVNIVKDAIPEENARQSNFDPAQWIGRWIANPLPALGGATPTDYLATGDGRTIVKRLLNNTLIGDYA